MLSCDEWFERDFNVELGGARPNGALAAPRRSRLQRFGLGDNRCGVEGENGLTVCALRSHTGA
jgi:hypothetical protein